MQASASGCCLTPAGDRRTCAVPIVPVILNSDEMDVVDPSIAPKHESPLVCRRSHPLGRGIRCSGGIEDWIHDCLRLSAFVLTKPPGELPPCIRDPEATGDGITPGSPSRTRNVRADYSED
jgi:hypothetical protein